MPSAPFNAWPPASTYPTVMLRVTLSLKWLTKYCATCTTPAVNALGAELTLESHTTLIARPVPEPLFTNVGLGGVVVPPPPGCPPPGPAAITTSGVCAGGRLRSLEYTTMVGALKLQDGVSTRKEIGAESACDRSEFAFRLKVPSPS